MTAEHYSDAGDTRRWWQIRWPRQRGRSDYERTIHDLRSSLETARRERDNAERMAITASARAQVAESKLAEMHRKLTLAAGQQQAGPVPEAAGAAHSGGPAGQSPSVATQLLFMADRLADFIAASAAADPERAGVMIDWINGMIQELLGECGITAFSDDGPLDSGRHEVVSVRPAPAPDLAGHIAETVRPGYEWQGELLRAQRVVAYSAAGDG